MDINAQLLPDGRTARVTIGNVSANMHAPVLDQFIAMLAGIRATIKPGVPHTLSAGSIVHQEEGMRFITGTDPDIGAVTLSIRSVAFGWIVLAMTPDDAGVLIAHLQDAQRHTIALNRSRAN